MAHLFQFVMIACVWGSSSQNGAAISHMWNGFTLFNLNVNKMLCITLHKSITTHQRPNSKQNRAFLRENYCQMNDEIRCKIYRKSYPVNHNCALVPLQSTVPHWKSTCRKAYLNSSRGTCSNESCNLLVTAYFTLYSRSNEQWVYFPLTSSTALMRPLLPMKWFIIVQWVGEININVPLNIILRFRWSRLV